MILKPTSKCNFKCTFCSSTKISEDDDALLDIGSIERFIKRFPNTNTIIVNGGDPLMVSARYYFDIIKILDKYNCNARLSLTTNLWPFYKKPEMWSMLFRHPRVGVCTSFQYGNKRLKGDLTPFTEEEFIDVSDLFLELIGYRPDFISVIDRDNEHTILDTVLLAKRLNIQAKINHVLASGPEVEFKGIKIGSYNNFYTQADIYKHYVMIYDAGLAQWEYNTQQMAKKLANGHTTCPLARNCDSHIRSLQPNNEYYSCGAFGDDREYSIDFDKEMSGDFYTPLLKAPELHSMKESCNTCPMFDICNGCKKTIHDTKRFGLVEYHCKTMKELAPRIIEINGMTNHLTVTPYIDESV